MRRSTLVARTRAAASSSVVRQPATGCASLRGAPTGITAEFSDRSGSAEDKLPALLEAQQANRQAASTPLNPRNSCQVNLSYLGLDADTPLLRGDVGIPTGRRRNPNATTVPSRMHTATSRPVPSRPCRPGPGHGLAASRTGGKVRKTRYLAWAPSRVRTACWPEAGPGVDPLCWPGAGPSGPCGSGPSLVPLGVPPPRCAAQQGPAPLHHFSRTARQVGRVASRRVAMRPRGRTVRCGRSEGSRTRSLPADWDAVRPARPNLRIGPDNKGVPAALKGYEIRVFLADLM